MAPFRVSEVSVTPEDCLPGDVVTVSGRMTAEEEGLLNSQTVRIRLRGNGQNSYTDTQIDAQGNFKANVRTDRSAYGWLTVQATAIGQTEAARTTRLHVYNQSLYCSDGTRWVVNENSTLQGYFTWVNLSAKPITTDPALTLEVSTDRRLTALFAPMEYDVTIEAEHAQLLAHTSGRFAAGATVQLALQPEPGYVFSHWLRNGDHFTDDAITIDVVRAATTYTAVCVALDDDAVSHIVATDGPMDIYSITGMCVRANVSDVRAALRGLPSGIYVIGGQKVLVR